MSYGQDDQAERGAATKKKWEDTLQDYKDTEARTGEDWSLSEGSHFGDALRNVNPSLNFVNPGSANYGGRGGVEMYTGLAREGMGRNDEAQRMSQAGLDSAYANMMGRRGPVSVENSQFANREAGSRGQQMEALNMQRMAAMGGAPSEAAYQARLGIQDVASGYSGQMGGARGLGGLAGAQTGGAAAGGAAAGNVAAAGGFGRSNEIGQELGQYGKTAGQVRGQDLTRLGIANQNAQFNAGLNNDWQLGNAGLAAGYGRLANAQAGMDQQWFAESMKPRDIQFQLDQEAAGWEAGAEMDKAVAKIGREQERQANMQSLVGGIAQAGLTAVGSLAGPAGAAMGGMAGSAIGAATKKYY